MMDEADHIRKFEAETRLFCAFLENAQAEPLEDRLREARRRVAALVLAACDLPQGDPDGEDVNGDASPVPDFPSFGKLDFYYTLFDPYELDAPVGGSLSNDLVDIYRDLQTGFAALKQDGLPAAAWEWRFSFDYHWGRHAVDVLSALHHACGRLGERTG